MTVHEFHLSAAVKGCPQRLSTVWLGSGATGGVGTRVVQTLLQQGSAVRALVRDEQKARMLLVSG